MATLIECDACKHRMMSRVMPIHCEKCTRPHTYSIVGEGEVKRKAIRKASEIEVVNPFREASGDSGLDSILLGGFALPTKATIFGRAGTGKSRSALRWSTKIGKTLLVTLEMPEDLAAYSAQQSRADMSNLDITEDEFAWQNAKYKCLIFDSFHYSRQKKAALLESLDDWVRRNNGIVFLICHSNKKGSVSGTTITEHWPDYLLKFEKHGNGTGEAKVIVPKARYAPGGSAIINI